MQAKALSVIAAVGLVAASVADMAIPRRATALVLCVKNVDPLRGTQKSFFRRDSCPVKPNVETIEVPQDLVCWDRNGDARCDLADEDVNGDGDCSTRDCLAFQCWDLNENGRKDANEDINKDGRFNTSDCQGVAPQIEQSRVRLDPGDDGSNTDLVEAATRGDTNGIFTEPQLGKLLIDVGKRWPTADVADAARALARNPNDCTGNQVAFKIDQEGNLECRALTDDDVTDDLTVEEALVGRAIRTDAQDLGEPGDIAIDAGQLVVVDSDAMTVVFDPLQSESVSVQSPLGGERAAVFKTVRNVQIESVECIVNPTAAKCDPVMEECDFVDIRLGKLREMSDTPIDDNVIKCNQNGASDDGLPVAAAAVDAGHWVYFEVSAASAGVTHLTVTVTYAIK
jgi:hypothetical protein